MARLKITRRCKGCEKPFHPWSGNTPGLHCSNKCRQLRVWVACKTCGKDFEVTQYRSATAQWCSRECAGTNAYKFWECVVKSDYCWTWTASKDKDGYGKFNKGRAHRASYEMAHGPIPKGMCVLHRCDNPPCVRPDHLFLGTNSDNMQDKIRKGRQFRGEQLVGTCKLTEAKVKTIRALAKKGRTHQVIADQFGVDRTNIGCVVRRKTWAHVD